MNRPAGDGEGRVEVTRDPRPARRTRYERDTQRPLRDRWFVAQYRRPVGVPHATEGRLKLNEGGWLDLHTALTYQEVKLWLDAQLEEDVRLGSDGLSEHRIVRRMDTPWGA